MRETIRLKHYSRKTKKTYVSWIRRFILFYEKKHPQQMGEREIEAFLSHLAVDRNVAASTRLKPHLLINAGAALSVRLSSVQYTSARRHWLG